jgi:hypothetical protein
MKFSYNPVSKGFYVRLMSPIGRYPAKSFRSPTAALIVSTDICFSIVQISKEDWSFSEVDILNKLEIPLFGSILLAGEAGTPYLYPYPAYSLTLETESLEKIEDSQIAQCKSILLVEIQKQSAGGFPTSSFHLPPCLGGVKYDLVPDKTSDSDRLTVLRRLEAANPVILRGVNCLMKARMAFQFFEFGEAACIFLWIALDAAHSLVLERLRQSGTVNPTTKDAVKYFEQISRQETDWERFFEDDYENRIRAIHPANRFGAEAIPQYLADDFLELYDSLIPLFEHIVLEFPNDFPLETEGQA